MSLFPKQYSITAVYPAPPLYWAPGVTRGGFRQTGRCGRVTCKYCHFVTGLEHPRMLVCGGGRRGWDQCPSDTGGQLYSARPLLLLFRLPGRSWSRISPRQRSARTVRRRFFSAGSLRLSGSEDVKHQQRLPLPILGQKAREPAQQGPGPPTPRGHREAAASPARADRA